MEKIEAKKIRWVSLIPSVSVAHNTIIKGKYKEANESGKLG